MPPPFKRYLSTPPAYVQAAAPPGGPDCLKCKFAVETMHTAVTSNDTVSQLLAQADALCAKYAAAFDMARGRWKKGGGEGWGGRGFILSHLITRHSHFLFLSFFSSRAGAARNAMRNAQRSSPSSLNLESNNSEPT